MVHDIEGLIKALQLHEFFASGSFLRSILANIVLVQGIEAIIKALQLLHQVPT
jgi:hypothetical protein